MRRLAWLALAIPLLAAAPAGASVRSCEYRNLTSGRIPYVARVRTDLTPAAVGGGSVCHAVAAVVRRVQRRGYDPGALAVAAGGGSWTVRHRLVYPTGWPRPAGPVQDPHMQVTLTLAAPPGGAPRCAGRAHGAGAASFWITLRELT
jgi:hypothetical protein